MKITGHTKIAGVIGENISYSKSPLIHNFWCQKYDIDGIYGVFNATPETFERAVLGLFDAGIVGLNITVPFKEKAFAMADILTENAQQAKAVNVLYRQGNQLYGDNTDGVGFLEAVKNTKNWTGWQGKKVLIIGAGGAAAGIAALLQSAGIGQCDVINRTLAKAEDLLMILPDHINKNAYDAYNSHMPVYDVIIQTTALADIVQGGVNDVPAFVMSDTSFVIDINYGGKAQAFYQHILSFTPNYENGLAMLVHQARPAFKAFYGTDFLPDADDILNILQNEQA
jgi:shikimate dehydrogenase